MKRSTYITTSALTLAAIAAAAIPVTWASFAGLETMFNAPLRWIPRDAPAREEFNRFIRKFDSHELLLVSWPGCTVDDVRLKQVAETLMSQSRRQAEEEQTPPIVDVITGYGLLRELMSEPSNLSRKQAIRRMQGTLVGRKVERSCAVVVLSERGSQNRRDIVDMVVDAVEEKTGYSHDELRMAGSPVDGIAIDNESIRSLQNHSLPAILISLVLCCICLRSIWLTVPIVAVAAIGQGATLAVVYWLGITMNAILIVLPALVFILTVSAGVHLVNYFYDELRSGPEKGATDRAMRKAWGPCTLAAVTTAVGLVSLIVSDVRPVRHFGALAAAGIIITVGLLFLAVPGVMEGRLLLQARRRKGSAQPPKDIGRGFWQAAAGGIDRYGKWIVLASFAALTVCGAGLLYLRSSVNMSALLDPSNRAVRDFEWFEESIGPLIPVEVVINFDESCPLTPLERLEFIRWVQEEIDGLENVDGAMSAASFFPNIPPHTSEYLLTRSRIQTSLKNSRESLIKANYLHVNQQVQSWRVSARMQAEEDVDHGRILDRLRAIVEPALAQYEQEGIPGVSATYTGLTAVLYEVEQALLADLFDSFIAALICVTLIMMLALWSIRAALVAMVPNVFPTVILFGMMGWLGKAVDIGTVMTASVALGIAVDGTFHFLKWFRHELAEGKTKGAAVAYAYRHCGRALVQTTIICSLGMLIFTLSGFLPARNFSLMLLLLLLAALVGDLVVLPALLVGPLGSVFLRRRRKQEEETGAASQDAEAEVPA